MQQTQVLINKCTNGEYFNYFNKDAAWKSTPRIKRKLEGLNFPKEIKYLIAEKRRLRRRWHQMRAPQDKTALNTRTQYNLPKEIGAIMTKVHAKIAPGFELMPIETSNQAVNIKSLFHTSSPVVLQEAVSNT